MTCSCSNDRREFIKKCGILFLSAGAAAYTLTSCTDEKSQNPGTQTITIDLNNSQNQTLKNPGGYLSVENPKDADRKIIVYRESASKVNAFSSRCTHMGGQVNIENNKAVCEAHDAVYDLAGAVLDGKGLTTKNLQQYPAVLSGSTITIEV